MGFILKRNTVKKEEITLIIILNARIVLPKNLNNGDGIIKNEEMLIHIIMISHQKDLKIFERRIQNILQMANGKNGEVKIKINYMNMVRNTGIIS